MKNLAIIVPIRKGSSRIKDKYKVMIGDRSITHNKFEQLAKLCEMIRIPKNKVFVSTDAVDVAGLAKEYGFTVHERSDFYSSGHMATFSELVVHLVQEAEKVIEFDEVLWTYPVTPLFDEHQYYSAIMKYNDKVSHSNKYDSLVSVNILNEYFWYKGKPLNYTGDKEHIYSQELEPLIRVNNACYMAPKQTMLDKEYFLGDVPYFFDTPKMLSVDIDTLEDLELANNIIKTL
tara:strand:+ start:329 stop:1024 length:696 start_codon:yes stop_codon:yes gene_type:complete